MPFNYIGVKSQEKDKTRRPPTVIIPTRRLSTGSKFKPVPSHIFSFEIVHQYNTCQCSTTGIVTMQILSYNIILLCTFGVMPASCFNDTPATNQKQFDMVKRLSRLFSSVCDCHSYGENLARKKSEKLTAM